MKRFLREDLDEFISYEVPSHDYKYKLDANESPWDIPRDLRKILAEELVEGLDFNRYPDSDARSLRNSIAGYCGVSPNNVVVGSGSDELIQIIINAFIGKGDAVIFPTPSFAMYRIFTIIGGGSPISIPLDREYNYDLEEFSRVSSENSAKLAILCSPNNPTGNTLERVPLEKFISSFPGIVVIDEAYGEFSKNSSIELIDKYPNLIILRTLSKAFGLAGLRIGYSLSDKGLASQLRAIKPPFNINSFSQRVGILALDNPDIMNERLNLLKTQREFVYNELKNLQGVKVYPSEANFLLFKVKSADVVFQKLLDKGILLRAYSGDKYLDDALRVTIADEPTNMMFIRTLREILNEGDR